MSRTRIAFCITDLDPGGAEQALMELVTRLDLSEWDPHVYCLRSAGALVEPIEAAGIPVTCLGVNRWWNVANCLRLHKALRRFQPQILQTFLFHANLVGRVAGTTARIPWIVSGIRVAEKERRWHLTLDRWSQRLVSHNLAVSQAVAQFAIENLHIPALRVSVIANGVDAERFSEAAPVDWEDYGIPGGSRVVLAIGRLHPQKGHDTLIEASISLVRAVPDLHVVIAGEGPRRGDLERQIQSAGCGDRIHLIGRQSNVAGLLRAATVFVLSSNWEGMPNVVLQAMAGGVPVVASDVEGVRELIADGEGGLVCEPGNPDSFRVAIRRVLDDAEFASSLARTSQSVVKERFSISGFVERYTTFYRNLVQR